MLDTCAMYVKIRGTRCKEEGKVKTQRGIAVNDHLVSFTTTASTYQFVNFQLITPLGYAG